MVELNLFNKVSDLTWEIGLAKCDIPIFNYQMERYQECRFFQHRIEEFPAYNFNYKDNSGGMVAGASGGATPKHIYRIIFDDEAAEALFLFTSKDNIKLIQTEFQTSQELYGEKHMIVSKQLRSREESLELFNGEWYREIRQIRNYMNGADEGYYPKEWGKSPYPKESIFK